MALVCREPEKPSAPMYYLGISCGPDETQDLEFVQSLARSTVIKMFRDFINKSEKKSLLFKTTLSELNNTANSDNPWDAIFYKADTFKAKAYKASVMNLMLSDAQNHGTDFLEYFCAQNYHLIWNSREAYARGYEGVVDLLVKKQN